MHHRLWVTWRAWTRKWCPSTSKVEVGYCNGSRCLSASVFTSAFSPNEGARLGYGSTDTCVEENMYAGEGMEGKHSQAWRWGDTYTFPGSLNPVC